MNLRNVTLPITVGDEELRYLPVGAMKSSGRSEPAVHPSLDTEQWSRIWEASVTALDRTHCAAL